MGGLPRALSYQGEHPMPLYTRVIEVGHGVVIEMEVQGYSFRG
jgi:hypothetical protein